MAGSITSLRTLMLSTDPEADLRAAYAAKIAAARREPKTARHNGRLRVLLVGYSGACNIGADLRTGEIIRQLRNDIPPERLELGVLVVGTKPLPDWDPITREYITGFAPDAVHELCTRYDAVVVCEGSLFTSTFSNGLATMLTAFLGIAEALGKPAVAWGAEADRMSPEVERFVRDAAKGALVVTRNAASAERLRSLGLVVVQGTDTGWTFDDLDEDAATAKLHEIGWDGVEPILAIAPTNPFRWPLVADAERALFASLSGETLSDHHSGIMFYQPTDVSEKRCTAFLAEIAEALRAHHKTNLRSAFRVVVGMEANDWSACEQLAVQLGAPAPIVAGEAPPQMIIAILRMASMLISARYHAILLSMRAEVPSIGLAYDQRVAALMAEASLPELALDVHAPSLRLQIGAALDRVCSDNTIGAKFATFAARQRQVQAKIGRRITAYLDGEKL